MQTVGFKRVISQNDTLGTVKQNCGAESERFFGKFGTRLSDHSVSQNRRP